MQNPVEADAIIVLCPDRSQPCPRKTEMVYVALSDQ